MPTPILHNPLSEANPESLSILFDRDPMDLTDEDSLRIVTELRAQRERWNVAEKKKKTQKPAASDTKLLTLSDLDIKL